MDLGLDGRAALVAAASEGIGRAVAQALAGEGCRIAICSRSKKRIDAAAEGIRRATGAEVNSAVADLTRPEAISRWVDDAARRLGRLDILVTNAGGPPAGRTDEIEDETWHDAVELTLLSVVRLCRAAVPLMRRANWGRIVNLASVSVRQPLHRMILSNTLRAGVAGFSKTLADELGPEGITVNLVCPGRVDTARIRELAAVHADAHKVSLEEILKAWTEELPARRLGRPEEIGDVVAFLCSERAGFITGTVVTVDGGFTKAAL